MATASSRGRRAVRATGLLGAYADTKRTGPSLVGPVHAHLLSKFGPDPDRRQDVIHPSEMAKEKWCPRQTAYRIAGIAESDAHAEKFSAQLQNIFAEGHTIHAKWQNWLTDMGLLWGDWQCRVCGQTAQRQTGPVKCMNCWANGLPHILMDYREIPLDGEARYRIAGHADGAVGSSLIEIKSIGMGTLRLEEPDLLRKHHVETVDGKKIYDLDALWSGIHRPLPSHLRQGNVYLRLAAEMGLPFESIIFLYEFKANQSVKEFTVKYSPRIGDALFDTALAVKDSAATGIPLARNPQFWRGSKPCSECPFSTLCWDGEEAVHDSIRPSPEAAPAVRRVSRRCTRSSDRAVA